MSLKVPLTDAQIEAAGRLHATLDQWKAADSALDRLRSVLPNFDADSCLLKAAAINQLYGTNVFAITRLASHAASEIAKSGCDSTDLDLVERIANMPANDGDTERRFVSFASKFCHFFVGGSFHIYDDAAKNAIKLHLGRGRYRSNDEHPYRGFCESLEELRRQAGLRATGRPLDHYLWITGQYMKWRKAKASGAANIPINVELRRVFEGSRKHEAAELDALLPAILDKAFKGEL